MKRLTVTRIKIIIITLMALASGKVAAQSAADSYSKSDSTIKEYLKTYGIQTTANKEIKVLKSGHEKFIDLFEEINKAKHHIHLEYFNFRNDSIANALFDLLGKKAEEGIEVRALFDAFGNSSNNKPLKKKHLKAIRNKGVEIEKFDPFRFPWINHAFHRDHRKIIVIDGKIGYIGGMNIADYYINGLPKVGEWRDIHARIEGNSVECLQEIFLDIWNETTGQNIDGESYYPYKSRTIDGTDYKKEIAIIDRNPKKDSKAMRRILAKAIESAENKVQIINPYFTPTRIIKKAIKNALTKGVDVEIMISGKSDIPFTPDATMYIANRLRKKGADIYIFNGGFHHSKVMMIDSLYCSIGSANLNSRSLRYDYEINAFIFDKETTAELIQIFNEDQKDSTLLTNEMYKKRGPWKKFKGWFAHLFTLFL